MLEAAARPGRLHAGLIGSLAGATTIAWVLTRQRMLGMDGGPGSDLGSLSFYVVSWVLMMAAMMFPSIAPMVLTFAFVQRRRRARGAVDQVVSTWLFVAGYLLVWSAFGLLAYGVFVALKSTALPVLSWHRGGRYVAAGVLLAAAIYQLTPAKDACLRRCRGPLDFVLAQWREGAWGAVRMGMAHGAWCVGCCWALMAALFALGVMSIFWMIVIGVLIAVEKLLPWRATANRVVTATLAALAVGVALVPAQVPGLTLPGSAMANRSMQGTPMAPAHGTGSMGSMH